MMMQGRISDVTMDIFPPSRERFHNLLKDDKKQSRNKIIDSLYYTTQNSAMLKMNTNFKSNALKTLAAKQLPESRPASNLQFYANPPPLEQREKPDSKKKASIEHVFNAINREEEEDESFSVIEEGAASEIPSTCPKATVDWHRQDESDYSMNI